MERGEELSYEVLLPRHTLEEALGPELAKQYKLRRGERCVYMPVRAADKYLCSCGKVNPVGEACGACGLTPELLDRQVLEELRREAQQRLEQEALEEARQEEERRKQALLEKKKKHRRIAAAVGAAVGVLALAAGAFWLLTQRILPEARYQEALTALEAKQYQEAHRLFSLAGDYKDSKEYLSRFYTPYLAVRVASETSGSRTTYEYDEMGRQVKSTQVQLSVDEQGELAPFGEPMVSVFVYQDGNALILEDWYGRREYTYDEYGSVLTEQAYYSDGQMRQTRTYTYQYDSEGRVLRVTEICSNMISYSDSYEQTVSYRYDEGGRITEQVTEANYPASMESNYTATATWTYREDGQPQEMVTLVNSPYDVEDNCEERQVWTYDSQGRQIKKLTTRVYPSNSLMNYERVDTWAYNSRGDMTEEISKIRYPNHGEWDLETRSQWTYDSQGRLVKYVHSTQYASEERNRYGGCVETETYAYDWLGRQTEHTLTVDYQDEQNDYGYAQRERTEYGLDGMPVKQTVYLHDHSQETTNEYIRTFNENGLVEKEEHISDGGSVTEYSYAYFYYPEGTERPENTYYDPNLSVFTNG